MNTHIDTLAEWWSGAEHAPFRKGDMLISRREGEPVAYEVYPAGFDLTVPADNVRVLHSAPKPKPAWHDADFVVARYENDDHWQGYLRSGDLWIDSEGQKYTTGVLHDVTPLIEAKVTDEIVDRVLDVLHAWNDTYPAGLGTKLAAAALGIEAE